MAGPDQASDGGGSSAIGNTYPLIERALGAMAGFVFGSAVFMAIGYFIGVNAVGPMPMWLVGTLVGVTWGLLRPPRIARPALPQLQRATSGQPAPVGALGVAFVSELERPSAAALVVGVVVGLLAIPAAWTAYVAAGVRPSLVVIGLVGLAGFLAAIALVSFVPPFILARPTRLALAAHSWLGAREFERAMGSKFAAHGFPVTPHEVAPWTATHPETDANREVHVELHLMAGDLDAALAAIDRLPDSAPHDRFTRALLGATVDYQRTGVADAAAAQAALEDIPPGQKRTEASVALAVFESRRRLPDGDWRAPLAASRPAIPESELVILVRDYGLGIFVAILRRTWIFAVVIAILALGLGIPIDLAWER